MTAGVVIWTGGRLIGPGEDVVTAVDHGLTVGDGVFETCAVVRGHAFALTRHLRRLQRSAGGLGLPAPDEDQIRDGVRAVLGAAGDGAGRVRVTVTAGPGPMGSNRAAPGEGRPTVIVAAAPASRPVRARAARVRWVRNERSAVAGLKTTSYAENVVALAAAAAHGADEAIMANTVGDLCEGTGSNIVVEVGGALMTPALSSGCLAGITRELFLEWAPEAGIVVREAGPGDLPFAVLDDVLAGRAQLALTSSTREVEPVSWHDGSDVRVGPVSLQAQAMFRTRAEDDLDP
ncbi:D-alanine aminotransferase [mine drainage metagenome]|uniref:D-alanine aminotransferase n=1 Tax=mine drainage metagenome TaxID=410659 RepID=A0A1J5QNU6_9ZZZZ